MEQICQSLPNCLLCTTRTCNWFPAVQQCLWTGRGQVYREPWECPSAGIDRPVLAVTNSPAASVDVQTQTDEPSNHLALIVSLSCILGLILLSGVAYGTFRVLQGRPRRQGHARLRDPCSSQAALIPPANNRPPTRYRPSLPCLRTPRPHHSRNPPPPPETPEASPRYVTPPGTPEEMELVELRPVPAAPAPAPATPPAPPAPAPPRAHLFGYNLRFGRGPAQTHSSGYNLRPRKP